MRQFQRSLLFLTLCLMICIRASAAEFRGYQESLKPGDADAYQYVLFGSYPTESDGKVKPVLWRILGSGVPEVNDVICYSNYPARKWVKQANRDNLSEENADAFCLMTEFILDMVLYNETRDTEEDPLDYEESAMYRTLNDAFIKRLFTVEEQSVLIPMPGRGLLALPSRKGELFREDYGFPSEDFVVSKTRRAKGTPYAYKQGLKRIAGYSWYFTSDWRRFGSRWIVGDNGHISVSGVDRKGGVRPVCYVHADQLSILSGIGTIEEPFVLSPR